MDVPAAARQRNPRGEGARLRERLVAAAVATIDDVGDVSRVSVRAIARRASVSPTAVYLHFGDRDELVEAAIDAGFAAFNDALRDAAAGATGPREQLLAMGRAYLAFAERQPALYAVIFGARRGVAALPGAHAVDRRAGFDALVALIGATGERDPVETAIAVWSALHGFASLRAQAVPIPWPTPDAFLRRTLAVLNG